jgi:hypothetical protein
MSIGQDILKDEQKRLKKLLHNYKKELSGFPNGSLSRKKRGNSSYVYLAYRKGNKVIFKYIGKEDSDKVKELEERIQERKKLENKIKKVKSDLAEVKMGLRAKK